MMRRTTEQITDVSCGNTAALVRIDQFLIKLGTLKTIEDAHNTADTKCSVSPVEKRRKGFSEVDQSSEKETELHLREQDG